MMKSPAELYLEQHTAANRRDEDNPHGEVTNPLIAQLTEHHRQLAETKSIEAKERIKAEILPDYLPYLSGVLDADIGGDDEVVNAWLLWSMDARSWSLASRLVAYAEKHRLTIPDGYKRSPAAALADEFSAYVLKKGGLEDEQIDPAMGDAFIELITQADIRDRVPDQAVAKLYRATGELYDRHKDYEPAIERYSVALRLDPKVGCTKLKEAAERALNNIQIQAPDATDIEPQNSTDDQANNAPTADESAPIVPDGAGEA